MVKKRDFNYKDGHIQGGAQTAQEGAQGSHQNAGQQTSQGAHQAEAQAAPQGAAQGAPQQRRQYEQNRFNPQNQGGGQNQGGQGQYQGQNRSHGQGMRNQPSERREYPHNREGGPKGFYRDRDALQRNHGGAAASSVSRFGSRSRTEETVEDIREDIVRIEKEIELEIKEIKAMKL